MSEAIPCMDLGLDIPNSDLYSASFTEFCELVDQMNIMLDPEIYLEAVIDPKAKAVGKVGRMVANAHDNAKKVAGAYGNVVDAKANVYRLKFDFVMGIINGVTKLIKYVTKWITAIPRELGRVAKKVARIPSNILSKVRGDISIFITAQDIEALYNNILFARLDQFLSTAQSLAQGDFWSTMLHRQENGEKRDVNDMKLCRKLMSIYKDINNVQFKQQTIRMNNSQNVELYFGKSKSIKFRDLSRKQYECTYYEALLKLMEDLAAEQQKLEDIDKALGDKFTKSKQNQNFGNLDKGVQETVINTLQATAKVINIVANIMKCAISDLKSMEGAVDVILEKNKIKPDKAAIKDAAANAEKVRKDAEKVKKGKA